MTYPEQIDLAWLAVDSNGNLAAMITAGSGPIPPAVLAHGDRVRGIERSLLKLPLAGTASIHVQVPNPRSFKALSERGLFVYDWTDVHRTTASAIEAYELVASPSVRLDFDSLTEDLKALAAPLVGSMQFGSSTLKVA